jgi:sugar lactone lactonase YvrE
VTVTSSDGTAVAGTDYTAVSTTVSFPRGQSGVSVCTPILLDHVAGESDETVTFTLSNVTGRGWALGSQTTATLTIHEMARTSPPRELTADLVSMTVTVPYVHLAWYPPLDGTAVTYVVLSGPSSSGPYTVLDTTNATSYDVTPAPEVDTYYFVEARNADGTDSDDSNQAFSEGFVPGTGLFWAAYSNGTIRTANPDGSGAHGLVPGDGGAFGVAVDSTHLYWADTGADAIMRSDLDGTNVTTLVTDAANSHPYGVAVDATHVYWTDMQSQLIKRADLDGTNVTTLIDGTGQLQPAAIAIDGTYLYLGDVAGNGRIMRATLNGTGLTTLVDTDPYPFAVAVDSGHIYWAVTGSNEGATGAIWRSSLTGTSAAAIVTAQAHPAGIAVDSTHIYWANANNGTINRSGLDGSSPTAIITGAGSWGGVAVQQ